MCISRLLNKHPRNYQHLLMNLYSLEGKHPQFSVYCNIHPHRLDCARGWSPDLLAGTTAIPSDRQFLLQWQAINWFCWKELCVEGKWWEGEKNWGFYFLHIIQRKLRDKESDLPKDSYHWSAPQVGLKRSFEITIWNIFTRSSIVSLCFTETL